MTASRTPSRSDGWIESLSRVELSAISEALEVAFPKLERVRIQEAAEELKLAIEFARTDIFSEQRFGVLTKASTRFVVAGANLRRLLEKEFPLTSAQTAMERLEERIVESAETASEVALVSQPRFSFLRFLSELSDLERVAAMLARATRSGRGAPINYALRRLASEVARIYSKLSPRPAAGIATDPDSGNPTGIKFDFAVSILKIAFPQEKPPVGIIIDAFRKFADAARRARKN
jgi:hypothetical protein